MNIIILFLHMEKIREMIWIGRSKALWKYKKYFPDFSELNEALNSFLKMSKKYVVKPGLCIFIYCMFPSCCLAIF